jgi:hypothetical protein
MATQHILSPTETRDGMRIDTGANSKDAKYASMQRTRDRSPGATVESILRMTGGSKMVDEDKSEQPSFAIGG